MFLHWHRKPLARRKTGEGEAKPRVRAKNPCPHPDLLPTLRSGEGAFLLLLMACYLFPSSALAKAPKEQTAFNAPFSVQAVVLQKAITLSWQWVKPEGFVVLKEFGFDVKRSDGKTFFTKTTSYQDEGLKPGSYSYSVRVRGLTKEKGKKVLLTSDWSETVSGKIVEVCPAPPRIDLTVTPTQKVYSSIPSLRFRLQGTVHMDKICSLVGTKYLLDTGRGINHSGKVPVDKDGRFDIFVNALGPEDEIPTGVASFSVSITAENEVGPATSDVYTLDVALQNPYAPR